MSTETNPTHPPTSDPAVASSALLAGRGPREKWTDSQCPQCNAIYLDADREYAQAKHDRETVCIGKLADIIDG